MKKNTTTVIAVIAIVIIAGIGVTSSLKKQNNSNLSASANGAQAVASNNSNTPATNQPSTNTPQLFSSSPISQYAFLISGPTLDQNAQNALAGFNVSKKALPDGSTEVTLTSTNTEYQTQTYTVKPGEKLYFIETMMGDDSNNQEKNLRDDMAVLVDANGYIVN